MTFHVEDDDPLRFSIGCFAYKINNFFFPLVMMVHAQRYLCLNLNVDQPILVRGSFRAKLILAPLDGMLHQL